MSMDLIWESAMLSKVVFSTSALRPKVTFASAVRVRHFTAAVDDGNKVILPRDSNQALGIGKFAVDFLDGKIGRDIDERVYERAQMFHTDSVMCGISALAMHTNAPTILRQEALQEYRDMRGAKVFGSSERVKAEKAIVANSSAVREWDSNGTVFGYNASNRKHQAGEFGHNDFYPVVIAAAQKTGEVDGKKALKAMILVPKTNEEAWTSWMLSPHDYGHQALNDRQTRDLMEKISFSHGGSEYDQKYPDGIPTSVEITDDDGKKYCSGMVMYPSGHARNNTADLNAILEFKHKMLAELEELSKLDYRGMFVVHYIPWRGIRAGKQLSDSKGASAAISTEAAVLCMQRAMSGFMGPRDVFRNPEAIFRYFEPQEDGQCPFDIELSHSGSDFAVMGMHFKLGLYEHQSAGALQGMIDILM
ncbi:hypothetical protein Pmar_PMAR026359 [Perkinsus marinus ATCC 50983]|uniref:MmgE/PrpD N-terminal domain-containing protein n=1 Tax=Perkinsus marinus (strain ATCC 50983 / TXsc) TaxID=423536 RepID=C5LEJ0_PERM5|nr:hypothetical protein Pmar_PMAR026359 [Perkinsus marinus ATCC 50983]EER04808.1 hypothetical protein Pmar_PMAR026359 [Perkinsus marinus ATCC 50983]|eukprot:XP_002772992.1 hypothetical protein Pmar_PMAR026359 [Perkinsus marinus ATCC 50983]